MHTKESILESEYLKDISNFNSWYHLVEGEQNNIDNETAIIKSSGLAIEFIENKTVDLCIEACRIYTDAFRHVKNPTDEEIIRGLRTNSDIMKFIDNPSDDVINVAVNIDAKLIKFVPEHKQTEFMKWSCLRRNWMSGEYITNMTEDMVKYYKRADEEHVPWVEPSFLPSGVDKWCIDYRKNKKK